MDTQSRTPGGLDEREELLQLLLAEEGFAVPAASSIAPVRSDGPSVLSSGQRRLWFLDRLGTAASSAYHIPAVLRVTGPIDDRVLARCLEAMAVRHQILAARFTECDGVPMQTADGRLPSMTCDDLSALESSERDRAVEKLVREELERPFDLHQGPMLRLTRLRLGPDDAVVVLVMHHIVSDGWSMGVIVRELGELYAAFAAGRPAPLPDLPIQYTDYARWQQQWLQSADMARQLEYWTGRLAALPRLALGTDRPRPEVATLRGGVEHVTLDPALADRLRSFSRDHHATLFMTLVAAFKVLLFRYTGQEDIGIGSPIANRNRPETEGLVGFFVNTVVLRTSLAGRPGFREVVTRVRERSLEAFAHQDLPFETLVDALKPDRSLSRNPLFQVLFALQNTPQERVLLPGATLTPMALDTATAKFDLSMYVVDEPAATTVLLEYNRDLFDTSTIRRMLAHFERLVRAALAEPDRDVSALPLLDAAERRQIEMVNPPPSPYPRDVCIHERFAQQAVTHADRVAVVCGGERLTYGELDCRASDVAVRLVQAGVGPDVPVGLCVERSIEMIVALVAILKAGGAYVPIDPAWPEDRIGWLLANAGVRTVLAHAPTLATIPAGPWNVVDLAAAVWAHGDGASTTAPRKNSPTQTSASPVPDNLAYVMYTSGSTGRPKGVSVTHRAVVRLVCDTDYVQLSADEVLLQFAPLAFDASTFEIWGALLNGGRLIVAPSGNLSLGELAALLDHHGVTTVWLTAGLFHQMVDAQAGSLARRRQVVAGGDVLSAPHVRRLLSGGCRVINGFGPTENTTFTCCHPMTRTEDVGEVVSIGRPIANTTVYVLDAWFDPVPISVCGELFTGGDGLARGYLGRPDLTAERFLPNPFDARPGARMYRTGDQARVQADGTIGFLGRRDHQVKLRGFRIELGEVEATLRQHPDVQDAVAVIREDQPGNRALVAYVATRDQTTLDGQSARQFLAGRLPDHMVPSRVLVLSELPLTPNGKVDRAALPQPEHDAERAIPYVAPVTPTEASLCAMWEDLLSVARVGTSDDFFELGGHSLLATQVASRVGEAFGVELPLRSFFMGPTVAGLAREIERLRADRAEPSTPAIVSRPRTAGRVMRDRTDAPVPNARRLS
ncbi:MAG: amino acid adenylation domain-containing protein [Acidobacteriota bacterium]